MAAHRQLFRFFGQHLKGSGKRSKSVLSTRSSVDDEVKYIVKSPLPEMEMPTGVTVPEYMQAMMGPWAHKTAYEMVGTGQKVTHSQVFEHSRSFGAALVHAGFRRGDVIGIVLQNIPEYASVVFGIWEAGLIASPVNPNYTPDEIQRQLSISGAKGIVTSPQFIAGIKLAQQRKTPNSAGGTFIVCIGDKVDGCHSYSEMIKTNPDSVTFPKVTDESSVEDTVLLPFSSGTTGPPKGVCLTQFNLLSNLIQGNCPELVYSPRLGRDDQPRLIGVLPYFHSYGTMVYLMNSLYTGAHTLCIPKFEGDLFLEAIRSHRPTALHLVPPLMSLINNAKGFGPKDFESLEIGWVGAAPAGRSLIEAFMAKVGREFYFVEGYGMTELSPLTHLMLPNLKEPLIGSCGVPISNTLTKIVDIDTGKALGRNMRGELHIKGPQMMKGYYNNEEATRHTIDADGWLHTGDIGYYDESGNCYIVDRIKELIKVKGFQVAPSELEDLLRNHENVHDVAVIGVPHHEQGEAPRAYIVRNCESVTEKTINDYLHPLISSFKRLKGGIEFVKTIPKAPSGKLLRRELLENYKKSIHSK